MILPLFLTLLVIALAAIGLGYYLEEPYHAFVGFFFLFLLGIYIFSNQLQFENGYTTNHTYTYNDTTILQIQETSVKTYDTFSDQYTRWFGVLLSVISAFGMIIILYSTRYKAE